MSREQHVPSVRRLVSGGQTGVDRGALDAAIILGLDHGGWCPRGRLAEDGRIPACYQLQETDADDYPVRTERNVLDSDGTLILYCGALGGGTELTYRLAAQHKQPVRLVDLDHDLDFSATRQWLHRNQIHVLNVAGPRESSHPNISQRARIYVVELLQ